MISLNLQPLMMVYKLNDIASFVKSLQNPIDSFDVLKYVAFSYSSTRSTKSCKLIHSYARNNTAHHFYFRRLAHLWNVLPSFHESSSLSAIMSYLKKFFWDQFILSFNPTDTCTFHLVCPCNRCVHYHSFKAKTHYCLHQIFTILQ